MQKIKLAGLMAAGAIVALSGAIPVAQAQMGAPMPPPAVIAPMPPGPGEVEFFSDTPKVDPGDNPANWSAQQNVVESRRYERLVHTSPAFRAARIRKECGGYSDAQAFQQCAATFN